jgi:hypothetical protein
MTAFLDEHSIPEDAEPGITQTGCNLRCSPKNQAASIVPFWWNQGCCVSVPEVYRSVAQLRGIRRHLVFESLGLAEQFLVVGRSPALRAYMAGIAHELLVKHKVRFQQFLHFAKRF